jgi:hypothetical protein
MHLLSLLSDVSVSPTGKVSGSGFYTGSLESVFRVIASTLIFFAGAIAVIMIIVGGLKYITSNGDPKAVEGAKNTILYSVIGLIVAILAYTVVNFVLGKFGG